MSSDAISEYELKLGAVECSFSWVEYPFETGSITRLTKCLFCGIPYFIGAYTLLWTIRELDKHVIESKFSIDLFDKLTENDNFVCDLLMCTEDVCIILGHAGYA